MLNKFKINFLNKSNRKKQENSQKSKKILLNKGMFRKLKIRQRLIISFLAISTVPLLVLGITSFNSARDLVSSIIKQYTEQVVSQFGNNISSELTKVAESMNSFAFSTTIQDNFTDFDELDISKKIDANNTLLKEMTIVSTQNKNILELRMYSDQGALLYVGTKTDDIDYEGMNDNFTESGKATQWFVTETNNIVYARKVVNISNNKWLGNLFTILDSKRINQKFNSIKLDENVEILFITDDGTVLYSSDKSKSAGTKYPYAGLMENITAKNGSDGDFNGFDIHLKEISYCNYYNISNTPFYIVTITPYSFLNSAANTIGALIVMTVGIGVGLSLILAFLISRSISVPLSNLVTLMRKARTGDFTETITDNGRDEISEVISNYNDMFQNIKKLIEQVKISAGDVLTSANRLSASSEQTYASSEQIAMTLQEVAKGSSEQAEEVSKTVEYMNNLSDGINKMTQKLSNMSNLISNTEETSNEAIQRVKVLNDRANQTREASVRIADEINSLNNDMKQIRKITKLIVAISDQTNLLSLNAAIEAARAGEAGRGFAVVADEVKKLADQTKEASIMINNIINDINKKTEHAVFEANNTSSIVQDQMTAVEETNDAFNTILVSMKEITEYMNEVEASVNDMLTLRKKTLSAMENISAVSEEAAATSQEVSASTQEQMASAEVLTNLAKEMDNMAKELENVVSMFKIE